MKIVVTGGAGYVGSALVQELTSLGDEHQIHIIDNLSRNNKYIVSNIKKKGKSTIILHQVDILDSYSVKKILKNTDVVYHLAGINAYQNNTTSHLYEQLNHWATSELANVIEEYKIPKTIFLSSDTVFNAGLDIDSDATPCPSSAFANATFRAEKQLQRIKNTQLAIIRVGTVFGASPVNHFEGIINGFVFDTYTQGRIQIEGNGRNTISYISLDSLVNELVHLLKSNPPKTIIHASSYASTILDVVEVLQDIYPNLEFIFVNPHLQSADISLKSDIKITNLGLKQELQHYFDTFTF
jgi:UDP-glucose 4-epimerase